MIVVLGQFEIHPDDAAQAAELMRTMTAETMKESGCIQYAFSVELSSANRFQLGEWWQDDAALTAHFQTPHMATFRAGLSKLRVLKRVVKKFEVTSVVDL